MKALEIAAMGVALVVLLPGGYLAYVQLIGNPRVASEIVENPDGERARKVMLLALPDGREIPVNYLRQGEFVYAAADGFWWRDLVGDGVPVEVTVRGERLRGTARAVLDDPASTARIFSQLRPNAIEGFGTLVEIRLKADAESHAAE